MKLKDYRLAAYISQVDIAAQLGVSYEAYQRWESGLIPVPKSKLEQLAIILKVSVEDILKEDLLPGQTRNDEAVRAGLENYGKVAIHFAGRGAPLLLSISKIAFSRLKHDLEEHDCEFLIVESQSNQSVIIRSGAVSDIFLHQEIHGIVALEADEYENHAAYENVELNDWAIVASIAQGDTDIEDFEPADVERVRRTISAPNIDNKQLIRTQKVKKKDLKLRKKAVQNRTISIFQLATEMTYQASNGTRRNILVQDACDVFEAFCGYIDLSKRFPDETRIELRMNDGEENIYINKSTFDYISIPTHLFECGRVDLLYLEDPD